MSGVSKSGWGKVKKSGLAPSVSKTAMTGARQVDSTKRPPVPLEDVDVSKITFGAVQEGKMGDRFVTMQYDDGIFEISLAELPDYSRMPFKAGPPVRDGIALGETWTTRIELTPKQYDKWLEIEAKLLKEMLPLRDQLFPSKSKKSMSEEVFKEKMNSQVQGPNVEKGYPASIKITVPHDEGKQPVVELMHLRGDSITRPTPGSIHDLHAKSAVAVIVQPFRGPYFGNQGGGIKLTARHFAVLTNMLPSSGPNVNYSKVQILDEDTPVNGERALSTFGDDASEAMHADDQEADESNHAGFDQTQMDAALAAQGGP